jgi:hypothetical protein
VERFNLKKLSELEGTGEWRRLHNEELNYLSDQIKKNEVIAASSTYGEGRGAYRILVGRPEGRRPLGRPKRRWEDNINMDLQEAGWGMD